MAQTIGSIDLASLKNLRDDVTQYFWFESNSSSAWGSGAHVTLYPESQFTDSTSSNYMKGQNIIMNTDGFSIRNGALPMMALDNDSLDFNAVNTTQGTYTTMATFGLTGATIGQTSGAHIQISSSGLDVNTDSSTNIASFGTSGARIGKNAAAHSVIDTNGQRFYASNGTTQLANIGYGDAQATDPTGETPQPYYTFGGRTTGSPSQYDSTSTYKIGDVCKYNNKVYVAINNITTPKAWARSDWFYHIGGYSLVEGINNIASGYRSHAEGSKTKAVRSESHAEGVETIAGGNASHAEGQATKANGSRSHAQNWGTIASGTAQTAIGKFNKEDTSENYALIIGDGSSTTPSNLLTVNWNGNVETKGDYITKKTTLSLGTYVASANLSSTAKGFGFSIPTGRVFPSGTTISKITFNILARASNANGSGYYIIKSSSGGTSAAAFDSSATKTFYNASNNAKSLTSAMWTKQLHGGTNMYIYFAGDVNDYFSGSSTITGYINNNACTALLTDIVVTFSIP